MARIKLPPPISGGIMLSYKCSAACRHCIVACSPKWRSDWVASADLERLLSHLAGLIRPSPWGAEAISLNYGLHFTGGEPFLNFELLLHAVELAAERNIPSTFAETNCSWCLRDKTTREKLRLLKKAGLRGLLVSVNPFYAEYVPFERTERCIRIGREVFGANVMVYQLEYYHRFKALGIRDRLAPEDYLARAGGEDLAGQVELFLTGRAARRLRGLYPAYPARRFFAEPCRPSFLRDWHNHFDNYGNFLPGYCGGISLGNWEELPRLIHDGIDLDEHPVLSLLVAEDVRGLLDFSRDFGYSESEAGYLSKCDLCLDLRAYLVAREDFPELRPREFYARL
jgi:hypothetical protein